MTELEFKIKIQDILNRISRRKDMLFEIADKAKECGDLETQREHMLIAHGVRMAGYIVEDEVFKDGKGRME